jgi:hypothetical protein
VPNLALTEDSFWNPLAEEWQTRAHDTDPSTWRNHVVTTGPDGASKLVNGEWLPLGIPNPQHAPTTQNGSMPTPSVIAQAFKQPIDIDMTSFEQAEEQDEYGNVTQVAGSIVAGLTFRLRVVVDQVGLTPALTIITKSYSITAPKNAVTFTATFDAADAAFPMGSPDMDKPLRYRAYFEQFPNTWHLVKTVMLTSASHDLSVTVTSPTQGTEETPLSTQRDLTNLANQGVEFFGSVRALTGQSGGATSRPATALLTVPSNRHFVGVRFTLGYSGYDGIFGVRIGGVTYQQFEVANNVGASFYGLYNTSDLSNDVLLGSLTGTYQYLYTWYNLDDGTESAPSLISEERTVEDRPIIVSVPDTGRAAQANIVKLYRIGGDWSEFKLVTELTPTGATLVYSDLNSDASLINSPILTSDTHFAPPEGLALLSKSQGVFWGAVADKLYLGEGNPNYWNPINTLDFPSAITATSDSAEGLLVFTDAETYLVRGTSIEVVNQAKISGSQGCLSPKTIASGNRAVWFVSREGICQFQGGSVNITSRPQLGTLSLDVSKAVFFNDAYYIHLVNGDIVVLDLRYLPRFYTQNWGTCFLAKKPGVLYAVALEGETCTVYEPEKAEALLEYNYKTGMLTENRPSELKSYDRFYIRADGSHEVEFFIDGQLVITHELDGTKRVYELSVPQAARRGYDLQLAMKGTGTIHEIEYKAEGRTNGK